MTGNSIISLDPFQNELGRIKIMVLGQFLTQGQTASLRIKKY